MDIGQRVAILRKSKKLTQEYIADKLGKTPQWLSNIERGERQVGANELAQIAYLLEVDPGIFFDPGLYKALRRPQAAKGNYR